MSLWTLTHPTHRNQKRRPHQIPAALPSLPSLPSPLWDTLPSRVQDAPVELLPPESSAEVFSVSGCLTSLSLHMPKYFGISFIYIFKIQYVLSRNVRFSVSLTWEPVTAPPVSAGFAPYLWDPRLGRWRHKKTSWQIWKWHFTVTATANTPKEKIAKEQCNQHHTPWQRILHRNPRGSDMTINDTRGHETALIVLLEHWSNLPFQLSEILIHSNGIMPGLKPRTTGLECKYTTVYGRTNLLSTWIWIVPEKRWRLTHLFRAVLLIWAEFHWNVSVRTGEQWFGYALQPRRLFFSRWQFHAANCGRVKCLIFTTFHNVLFMGKMKSLDDYGRSSENILTVRYPISCSGFSRDRAQLCTTIALV